MGIKKLLGGNTEVDFVSGYCRDEEANEGKENETNWQEASLENGGGSVQSDKKKQEEDQRQEEKQISLAQKERLCAKKRWHWQSPMYELSLSAA